MNRSVEAIKAFKLGNSKNLYNFLTESDMIAANLVEDNLVRIVDKKYKIYPSETTGSGSVTLTNGKVAIPHGSQITDSGEANSIVRLSSIANTLLYFLRIRKTSTTALNVQNDGSVDIFNVDTTVGEITGAAVSSTGTANKLFKFSDVANTFKAILRIVKTSTTAFRVSDNSGTEVFNVNSAEGTVTGSAISKLKKVVGNTIRGNNTVTDGDGLDLTPAQVRAMITDSSNRFITDSERATWSAQAVANTVFGVQFLDNGSGFNATRYGLASGKDYRYSVSGANVSIDSDFDTLAIFKNIRRCICNNENVPVAFYGDSNYDDTLTLYGYAPHTHYVGVYIPKFYYRYKSVYSPTPMLNLAISDSPFDGAIVHEWFTNIDRAGIVSVTDYKIFSAFEGIAVNKTTGAYIFTNRADSTTRVDGDFKFGTLTDYANYMLTSVNKANKQAPVTNATLSNFRTMAQNRSSANVSKRVTSQMDFWSYHAINMLFMVEFASTNWQGVLSSGVSNLAAGTYNESISSGYTSVLGNKSGYVTGIVRGTLGTTQACSYRGIENFFGNIWKFMEGFKKSSTNCKIGNYDATKTNDYSIYGNSDFYNEKSSSINTTSEYTKLRNIYLISDAQTAGTNYYNDYEYYNIAGQIALVGGYLYDSGFTGGFCLNLTTDFAFVDRTIGGRIIS